MVVTAWLYKQGRISLLSHSDYLQCVVIWITIYLKTAFFSMSCGEDSLGWQDFYFLNTALCFQDQDQTLSKWLTRAFII